METPTIMSDTQHPDSITLVSNDGESIIVPRQAAKLSSFLADMLEDVDPGADQAAPIPNTDGVVLKKVMEWCEHHKDDPPEANPDYRKMIADIEDWDRKFLDVDEKMLFDIIIASNYLDIKPLLEICFKTIANMIQGKSAEEIRKTLNITDDLSADDLS